MGGIFFIHSHIYSENGSSNNMLQCPQESIHYDLETTFHFTLLAFKITRDDYRIEFTSWILIGTQCMYLKVSWLAYLIFGFEPLKHLLNFIQPWFLGRFQFCGWFPWLIRTMHLIILGFLQTIVYLPSFFSVFVFFSPLLDYVDDLAPSLILLCAQFHQPTSLYL